MPKIATAGKIYVGLGSRGMNLQKVSSSSVSSFSPSDISGLRIWYKSDSLSLNDNDSVTTWTDSSGNANNATEATNPPIYKTNIINSKPVVRFDGTNDVLNFSNMTVTAFTLSAVVISRATHSYEGIFQCLSDSLGFVVLINGTGQYWGHRSGSGWIDDGTTIFTTGTPVIVTYSFAGGSKTTAANYRMHKNSTEVSTTLLNTIGGSDSANAIGRESTTFAQVDIPEILVYNSALSDSDRSNVVSYLNTKYAVF